MRYAIVVGKQNEAKSSVNLNILKKRNRSK